jgi:high-affinity nickel-transport protein
MANFDINKAGFIMVGLFLVIWVVAVAVWKYGNVEHRWERAADAARVSRGE